MPDHRRRSDRIPNLQPQEGSSAAGPAGTNPHSRHGSFDSQGSGSSMGSHQVSNAGGQRASGYQTVAPVAPLQPHSQPQPQHPGMNEHAGRIQARRYPSFERSVPRLSREVSFGPAAPGPESIIRPAFHRNGHLGREYGSQLRLAEPANAVNNGPVYMQQQGRPPLGLGGGGQVDQLRPLPGRQGCLQLGNTFEDSLNLSNSDDQGGSESDDSIILSQHSIRQPRLRQNQLPVTVPFPHLGGSQRSNANRWEQAEHNNQENAARNNQDPAVHNITLQIIRNINQSFFTCGHENEVRAQLYDSIYHYVLTAIKNGWIPSDMLQRWGPGGCGGSGGPSRGPSGGSSGSAE